MSDATVALTMFVIYWDPSDYPRKFVVREWRVSGDKPGELMAASKPTAVVDTVEEARAAVPPYLVKLACQDGDDPAIYETWL